MCKGFPCDRNLFLSVVGRLSKILTARTRCVDTVYSTVINSCSMA